MGSQQFGLLSGVTQSLAGRVGLTRLLPLALAELPPDDIARLTPDALMLRGLYERSGVKVMGWRDIEIAEG